MVRPDRRHFGCAAVAVVFAFFLPLVARADWAVHSLERQPGANAAIEYFHFSLGQDESGSEVEVQMAVFSKKEATLRVIDQPASDRRLAGIMAGDKFFAGVNGGYFDPEGAPVGLLISGGETIAPLRTARLLSGVVAVSEKSVEIFRASEFPRKRAWREALQCGPFLIEHGKSVAGLDDTRTARRTFVLTTKDGRVAIGSCAPVTLAGLAKILSALAPLQVTRALNLDGGSSSAFWCRTSEKTISISEYKLVRNFLAIVPRK